MAVEVPPPGPHGGDVLAVARALGVEPDTLLDLSASLNPFAPDVAAVVGAHLDAVGRYPDPTAATAAVATAIGVETDRVLLTNGGAEAIALVAAQHPAGWIDDPEFSLYRHHLGSVAPGRPRWRSNPSNPIGALAEPDEQAAVWDEAFYPLATGAWTRGDDDAYRLGSLTKLWACPGLRLGYVIAPSAADRDALAQRQPRWAVNGLAIGVVEPLLAMTDLAGWAAAIAELRQATVSVWADHGLSCTPSAANWVLVERAAHLRDPLARRGILVRDCESFGLHGTIRCAVPDGGGLERLAQALTMIGARTEVPPYDRPS